jgi:hypothetical protein
MRKLLLRLGLVLFLMTFVNGIIYFDIDYAINGSAWHGKITDGKYYVGSHGRLTEVSSATYQYSRIHGMVTLGTVPIGIGGFLLIRAVGGSCSRITKPNRRDWIYMLLGGAIGSICGFLLVVIVPKIFHSHEMRYPWAAIPEGFLLGLALLCGWVHFTCTGKKDSQETNC